MKKTFHWFLTVSFCLIAIQGYSQNTESYYVIHIKGKIRNLSRNEDLKSGVKIFADDKLSFSNDEAVAVVMSTEKGRMILKKNPQNNTSGSALWSFVKNNLLPVPVTGKLSSRTTEESITNLKSYFGEKQYLIIGKKIKLVLNAKNYPLSANRYVGIQYQIQNKTASITKKIPFEGKSIIIHTDSLFYPDAIIKPDSAFGIRIFYMNLQKGNVPQESLNFQMIIVTEDSMKAQLSAILSACKEKKLSKEAILQEFSNYIMETYGKTDERIFNSWVEQNIVF